MNEIKERKIIAENEIKILEERKGFIQESLNEYYNLEKKRIDEKLTFVTDKAVSEISDNINNLVKEKQEELNEIQQILEKHQAMRAAVNEDIMRERQL
jgi:gas vesicle protein